MKFQKRFVHLLKIKTKKIIKMKLKGEGFILRHTKIADAKDCFECEQDEEAKRNFMSTPESINEVKKDIKKHLLNYNKKKPSGEQFIIEVNKEFAGWVTLSNLNIKHHEHQATIGYCLSKKFRGKGITTKAVKLVTDYAFKKYKLKRIEGWCRTFNKASARVLEKAGYKLEGILRKNKFKDGEYLDDMVWAKVK